MGSPTSFRLPATQKFASDPENDYAGYPRWEEIRDLPGVKGYRGIFPTPAEDFALPTPEEEGWGLI